MARYSDVYEEVQMKYVLGESILGQMILGERIDGEKAALAPQDLNGIQYDS